MNNIGYSIRDLEVLSGIKAHTIRIWEKRYHLLEPERTPTNIRLYNDDDLRRMLNVSILVRNGFKISKVAQWDDEVINREVLDLAEKNASTSGYIDRLILYMVNFNNDKFVNLINGIIDEYGLEDAVAKVFFEFFVKVGVYWQVGSVFPAQEHYVSNIIRNKIIAETDRLTSTSKKRATILFFLPDRELHEVSLLFYNYLAKKMGYETIYLGQYLPWNDLEKMKKQVNPDYIFTAFINAFPKEELKAYLQTLKQLFGDKKIFVTGWQLQLQQPEIPRNVKVIMDYHDFKRYLK